MVIHDPLYKWSLSPVAATRRRQQQAGQGGRGRRGAGGRGDADDDGDDDEEEEVDYGGAGGGEEDISFQRDTAERTLQRIRDKLQGFEDPASGALGVEGQVTRPHPCPNPNPNPNPHRRAGRPGGIVGGAVAEPSTPPLLSPPLPSSAYPNPTNPQPSPRWRPWSRRRATRTTCAASSQAGPPGCEGRGRADEAWRRVAWLYIDRMGAETSRAVEGGRARKRRSGGGRPKAGEGDGLVGPVCLLFKK